MDQNEDVVSIGNTPEDPLTIVDGGFISWVFGSSPERVYLWKSRSWQDFSMKRRALIVMDNPHLLRKDFYPPYKGHRQLKAENDPVWAEKVDCVRQFRTVLRETNLVKTIEQDGLEADDLITAFSLLYWREFDGDQLPVIAADKDLLQLNDFLTLSGYGATKDKDISFEAFRAKQAVCIQPVMTHHSQILLVLALLGDKSDDVPRLVPPRRLEIMVDILQDSDPWGSAARWFGEDLVKRNLYMTVLPGPWAFAEVPTVDEVFKRVREFSYLSYKLSPTVLHQYNRFVRPLMY